MDSMDRAIRIPHDPCPTCHGDETNVREVTFYAPTKYWKDRQSMGVARACVCGMTWKAFFPVEYVA